MGVYDQINLAESIGDQLPGYDADRLGTPAHKVEWQTKDIGHPFKHRYRITAEGALEKYGRETEEIPESEWTDEQRDRIKRVRNDDENTFLPPSLRQPPTRTTEEWWERMSDWHGVFEFCDYFDVGEDRSEQWRYQAQFVHGELNRISLISPEPDDDGIADFESDEDFDDDREMQEYAEALHLPLADLERSEEEWDEFDKEIEAKYWRARKRVADALERADERMQEQHWKVGPERVLSDIRQSIDYLEEIYDHIDSQTQVGMAGLNRDEWDLVGDDWYYSEDSGQSQDLEEYRGRIQEIIDEDRELLDRLADEPDSDLKQNQVLRESVATEYGDGPHERDPGWLPQCSIEGCENPGRHEFSGFESEYYECDEHFYEPPDDGWQRDVGFVYECVSCENEQDERCPECRVMNLCSTMAKTEAEGFGPAYVCFECGWVDRI